MEMVPYQNALDYLTAMPMFILMGMIIAVARIGSDMYAAAHKWVGVPGGLASATVIACAGMGAITGAAHRHHGLVEGSPAGDGKI